MCSPWNRFRPRILYEIDHRGDDLRHPGAMPLVVQHLSLEDEGSGHEVVPLRNARRLDAGRTQDSLDHEPDRLELPDLILRPRIGQMRSEQEVGVRGPAILAQDIQAVEKIWSSH